MKIQIKNFLWGEIQKNEGGRVVGGRVGGGLGSGWGVRVDVNEEKNYKKNRGGGSRVRWGVGLVGFRMDVNAMLKGRGDVGYGGCEPRIEGIVQCTKRYCTMYKKVLYNIKKI